VPISDPEQWRALTPYLDEALELDEEQRTAWLSRLSVENPSLAAQLEPLLLQYSLLAKNGFMNTSPTPVSIAESDLVGQVIGSYTLISLIGQGGMGSVWLAERSDGRFERRVAVKFLNLALVSGSNEERFKREGSILGRLAHPHIAELVDAGVSSSGFPYIVLEYVEGDHIHRYCDLQKLGIEERIRLFLEVASAVAHAHANLIVHRDLKPSNVLVSKSGQVKLLDFGIAKLIETENSDTALTALTGPGGQVLTPEFAAPEQITGAPVTTATDVYALGVLLYLLLTGQHPAGPSLQSPAQLVKAIVDTEPQRLSDIVTAAGAGPEAATDNASQRTTTPDRLQRLLRGDLDTIVARALKKDPRERYASVTEFADDLRRYLNHKTISARPDTLAYRAKKFVRRNRAVVALATLAAGAMIAGLIGTLLQARTARTERDFAFQQLKRSQEHDEFLEFLLSDAAPSGKPFSVTDLLGRAEQVVEKQHSGDPLRHADLLMWIGTDYSSADQSAKGRALAERAYQMTRGLSDPSIRGRASCTLAYCLSEDEDLPRAEGLVQEGLRELPGDPRYAIDRVNCLRTASEVARQSGRSREGVTRSQAASRIAQESPLVTDMVRMQTSMDLASAYSETGQDSESLAEFQRAASLLASAGWEETNTSVTLFSNWALELDQIGRPLEAETIQRRVIDLARDGSTMEAVTPMVLNNYARILHKLNRLDEAANFAQSSYDKALKAHNQLAVGQSALERARIATAQHKYSQASALISEVEPMLRKNLPPTHYAFAVLASDRAAIAQGEGDLALALKFSNQAVAIGETGLTARGEGAFAFPGLLLRRSAIELASRDLEPALADADRALSLQQAKSETGTWSNKLGYAYLAQARALDAQGKHEEARGAARSAFDNLEKSVGPDHPETRAAQQLAASSPPPSR
jgi:serine/threonine protein kinase